MSIEQVIDALAVTAETFGQPMSASALVMLAQDLEQYPEATIFNALRKVRRECRRLTLADIIDRMESSDGRPAADEAWMNALIAQDESATVVWTQEAAQAFEIARPALTINDKTGARMAFKAAYDRLVEDARKRREPAKWSASLGWDSDQRIPVLQAAVECGRLPAGYAAGLMPPKREEVELFGKTMLKIACIDGETIAPEIERREFVRRQIANLRATLEKK